MMKFVRVFTILAALLISNALFAQIAGTAHDFSGQSWNATGEICVVCHTPHNANTTVTDAPLWNHQLSTATYTLYSSATLDATVGQPNGLSKLCLSCHDGTVALDNFGGTTSGTNYISAGRNVGTDLSDDHPVGITYDATLASTDGGLYDPTTTNSGLGSTIDADLLFNGQLECASCHDVHNSYGNSYLLRKSNSGSALCLTCHNK